jgi:endonuclease G
MGSPGRPGTTGTLGCIVYAEGDKSKLLLSCWHVLSGVPVPSQAPSIVQPGELGFDVVSNIVGHVVGQIHGTSGDSAVARITATDSTRKIDSRILGLEVSVREVVNPKEHMIVVKSGRTSGVTFGVVNALSVHFRDNTGAVIECFEIRPFSRIPTDDGEITKGGDSGAAWMMVEEQQGGRYVATASIVGIQCFGQDNDPADERALASYASSVFKALRIKPET